MAPPRQSRLQMFDEARCERGGGFTGPPQISPSVSAWGQGMHPWVGKICTPLPHALVQPSFMEVLTGLVPGAKIQKTRSPLLPVPPGATAKQGRVQWPCPGVAGGWGVRPLPFTSGSLSTCN